MFAVVNPTIQVQNPPPFVPSYLTAYWRKLGKAEFRLRTRENELRIHASRNARDRHELSVLSKVAEPTTEVKRLEKARAVLEVVEILDNLVLLGIAIPEVRKYLGVRHSGVRRMIRNGELKTFDCNGVAFVTVQSVTDILSQWAAALGVHPPPVAG